LRVDRQRRAEASTAFAQRAPRGEGFGGLRRSVFEASEQRVAHVLGVELPSEPTSVERRVRIERDTQRRCEARLR